MSTADCVFFLCVCTKSYVTYHFVAAIVAVFVVVVVVDVVVVAIVVIVVIVVVGGFVVAVVVVVVVVVTVVVVFVVVVGVGVIVIVVVDVVFISPYNIQHAIYMFGASEPGEEPEAASPTFRQLTLSLSIPFLFKSPTS